MLQGMSKAPLSVCGSQARDRFLTGFHQHVAWREHAHAARQQSDNLTSSPFTFTSIVVS